MCLLRPNKYRKIDHHNFVRILNTCTKARNIKQNTFCMFWKFGFGNNKTKQRTTQKRITVENRIIMPCISSNSNKIRNDSMLVGSTSKIRQYVVSDCQSPKRIAFDQNYTSSASIRRCSNMRQNFGSQYINLREKSSHDLAASKRIVLVDSSKKKHSCRNLYKNETTAYCIIKISQNLQ